MLEYKVTVVVDLSIYIYITIYIYIFVSVFIHLMIDIINVYLLPPLLIIFFSSRFRGINGFLVLTCELL